MDVVSMSLAEEISKVVLNFAQKQFLQKVNI